MTEETESRRDEQEVGLYEKIAGRTAELLEEGKKTFEEALKKAKEEIAAAGDYSREQAERIGQYVRRDLTSLGEQSGKAREAMKRALDPTRVATGMHSVLARILGSTAETLSGWAEKSERQLEFKTGEVTSLGTLTCKGCGADLHMKSTARIPPCPKCRKTVFRKSY